MLDCQVAMLSYQAAYHLMSGTVPGPQGKSHDSIPTYRSFRCRDGVEIVVAANTEAMWRKLCLAIGLEGLADDPRFVTNKERFENRAELDAVLEAAFLARDAGDMVAALVAADVPAGPINSIEAAMLDEQVLHRGMVMTLRDATGDEVRVAGNPVTIRGVETPRRFPPALGEDGPSLLEEFAGLDRQEIQALEKAGTIVTLRRDGSAGAAAEKGGGR